MANSVDPDQMQNSACLIWVYTVCKGLSVPVLRVITVHVNAFCDCMLEVSGFISIKLALIASKY